MSSSPGKWEVVGKDGKPRKNTSGNKKNKQKINEADLPKLDIKAPIPESKTQFDAFSKKEPDAFVIPKQESSDNDSDRGLNFRNEDRNKKLEKKHRHYKEPQQSFDDLFAEALKKCDPSSVKHFIAECKQKHPNSPLVLLKDLTGFLQDQFVKMAIEKDPVLGSQSLDFPLDFVDNNVQNQITDVLKDCNNEDVDRFFSYCLDELLIEINKGHATYGIRMMIQSVVKFSPSVTLKTKYLQRVTSRKENPREALSLLWVFGQTSDHLNLEERIIAWTRFFLPVIETKHLSKYVVDYLETTLRLELPERLTGVPISGKTFLHIMRLTYGSNYVNFPYRKQLQLLNPEIKAIVFNARPTNAPLTGVFCQLFDSLNAELEKEYSQEALNCLVECLRRDPACLSEWKNNYLARMKESSLLLKAVVTQWDSVCRSVPRKYLIETLLEFQSLNSEYKEREKHKAVLLDCEASCKKLLDLISSTQKYIPRSNSSRITRIFKVLLCILLMVVCIDIYKNGGYQKSKTSQILKQYGVEKVLLNTYGRGKLYAYQISSWTEKHYPYYYKKIRDVIEPASDYTITKLGEGLYYLAEVTAPARLYIHKHVPPLLEECDRFVSYYFNLVSKALLKLWGDYSPVVRRYAQSTWDTIAIWIPSVWSRAQFLAIKAATWFYNLSPEFFDAIGDGFRRLANEVVTKTPRVLALVQEYLLTAWTLLVSYLSNVVLWLKTNVISARLHFIAANASKDRLTTQTIQTFVR